MSTPHRLVIPVTALLAIVLTVVLFTAFYHRVDAQRAVYLAALISFSVTAFIGMAFKPLLGE
jgi:hypothetical protein